MFRVYYKYSACIKVCTEDIAILCDPWFGGNAYEGTWGQYPSVKDARKLVGNFDAIYISHIHPDHYCAESIAKLLSFYGPKPIWIADWGDQPNYLAKKIESDGLGKHISIAVINTCTSNFGLTLITFVFKNSLYFILLLIFPEFVLISLFT
jgi:L-ascorbate metabolism protein UlaG (beta-lactamase superfamily)